MNHVPTSLVIDADFLEKCGTATLIGTLMKNGEIPKEVTLVFPIAGLKYCQANGGPGELIIPDYAAPCLIEDILRLVSQGVKVNIKQEEY